MEKLPDARLNTKNCRIGNAQKHETGKGEYERLLQIFVQWAGNELQDRIDEGMGGKLEEVDW